MCVLGCLAVLAISSVQGDNVIVAAQPAGHLSSSQEPTAQPIVKYRVSGVQWSPHKRKLAFSLINQNYNQQDNWLLYSVNADGTALTKLKLPDQATRGGSRWQWINDERIMVGVLDPDKVSGELVALNTDNAAITPLLKVQLPDYGGGHLDYKNPNDFWDFAPDSKQIAFCGNGGLSVMKVDDTTATQLVKDKTAFDPAWSPDENQLLFVGRQASQDYPQLFVINQDGSYLAAVDTTNAPFSGFESAEWMPDGQHIEFFWRGMNTAGLYWSRIDGSDPHDVGGDPSAWGISWSPDRTKLAFVTVDDPIHYSVHVIDSNRADDWNKIAPIFTTDELINATWLPNGKLEVVPYDPDSTLRAFIIAPNGTHKVDLPTDIRQRVTLLGYTKLDAFIDNNNLYLILADGTILKVWE